MYASSLIFLLARCKNNVALPTDIASTFAAPWLDCFLINMFVGVTALSVPPPDTVNSPPAVPIIKVLVDVINLIALTWLDAIV
uniref:Putative tail tubular protein B n=1 Tax=uncultured marine virus TaxID=186617 RepID=A0A0F7LAM7_9VIRU|nr:putative tail tubular protein B [uncultured marine virus]